jgi:hypothetical protein
MAGELKLQHYSLEGCVAAVLRRRVPQVAQPVMASWFNGGHAGGRLMRLMNKHTAEYDCSLMKVHLMQII